MSRTLKFIFIYPFLWSIGFGQKKEYIILGGTGLFRYNYIPGKNGFPYNVYSTIVYDPYPPFLIPIFNTPYPRGNDPGNSFHFLIGKKRFYKYNFIISTNLFFESKESKKPVTYINDYLGGGPATGQISLRNNLIGLSCYLGKRFYIHKSDFYLDFLLGLDIMVPVSRAHLKIDAIFKADGLVLHKDDKSSELGDEIGDFRINGRIDIGFKRWGISSGYAFGLHNPDGFSTEMNFDLKNSEAGRYLYTGLFYLIKNKGKN